MREESGQMDQQALAILEEIRDILRDQVPKPKAWWKRKFFWVLVAGLVLLCLIRFPSQASRRADMVVTDGATIAVFVLPQPKWSELGLLPNADYRKIPDYMKRVEVMTLLVLNLAKQGRIYKESGVRVTRRETGVFVDLHSAPVLEGPTRIEVRPAVELTSGNQAMIRSIIRNYGIEADGVRLPLHQFVDYQYFEGHLIVETRAPIGYKRFLSNMERAFSLVF